MGVGTPVASRALRHGKRPVQPEPGIFVCILHKQIGVKTSRTREIAKSCRCQGPEAGGRGDVAENVSKRGVQGFRLGGYLVWDEVGTKCKPRNYSSTQYIFTKTKKIIVLLLHSKIGLVPLKDLRSGDKPNK